MHGLHLIVKVIIIAGGHEIGDTQCGFKLFSKEAALAIFPKLHVNRWAFDLEIVVLSQYHDLRIKEIPVVWNEIPGSKLSLLTATLNMLLDIARIRGFYMLGIWNTGLTAAGLGGSKKEL